MSTRYLRRTARVLVTDCEGLCLLFRFTPERMAPFWFTPGGECEPGENFAEAARRELFEETGIRAEPTLLAWTMEYDYTTPDGIDAHAVEHWFHHQTQDRIIDTSGHTELERACMREHRWFAMTELTGWHETVYPHNLARLVERAASKVSQ